MDSVLSSVASSLHTTEEFKKFEEWLASCTQCTEDSLNSARGALARARASYEWAEAHKADILKSLKSFGSTVSASLFVILAGLLFTVFTNNRM